MWMGAAISMNEPFYASQWRQAVSRPTGIRARCRQILRDAALSLSATTDRTTEPAFLRCLYCHYVFDDQRTEFERIIRALKGMGEFIGTDRCLRMLRGEEKVDRPYFHLSFDDGFRNNLTNAVPILRTLDVPAIFFVPSAMIEADRETAQSYCLNVTHYRAPIEMLTWKDLNNMLAMGFEIGSHTRTHARFSAISADPKQMEDEIAGSKKELEDRLEVPCPYISWPYGKMTDADGASLGMVRKAGYSACFGAYRGTIRPGTTDPFCIPRHHFEAQWPLSHVTYFARGKREVAA